MKFFRGVIGYCLVGMIVMSVWGVFVDHHGIFGGILAALLIIGPMWFLNHYVGLIYHADDSAFVDMGLGVGVTGMMLPIFQGGGMSMFIDTIPTLSLVAVGAVAGGVAYGLIQKDMNRDAAEAERNEIEEKAA